jgi:hypothetical protein
VPNTYDLQESIEKTRQALRSLPEAEPAEGPVDRPSGWSRAVSRDRPELHPFFRGLLDLLPEPGASWPQAKREQWLETARSIFNLLYEDAGDQPATAFPHQLSQVERPAA